MKTPKKKLIITVSILLVICLLSAITIMFFSNKSKFGDVHIGMSFEDLMNTVPESDRFCYINYVFYTNEKGNYVVARFSDETGSMGSIVQLKHFYKKNINPTPEAFSKIKSGMSIFDVVKLVGIPFDSYTFGMDSLAFKDTNGDTYSVYISLDDYQKDTKFTVTSVVAH